MAIPPMLVPRKGDSFFLKASVEIGRRHLSMESELSKATFARLVESRLTIPRSFFMGEGNVYDVDIAAIAGCGSVKDAPISVDRKVSFPAWLSCLMNKARN